MKAPRYEVAVALERAALARARTPTDHVIETNVEFWAAVILDFAGVPPHMMPALFTCARTRLVGHILEQKREAKLVRPSAQYIGPGTAPRDVEGVHQPPACSLTPPVTPDAARGWTDGHRPTPWTGAPTTRRLTGSPRPHRSPLDQQRQPTGQQAQPAPTYQARS